MFDGTACILGDDMYIKKLLTKPQPKPHARKDCGLV